MSVLFLRAPSITEAATSSITRHERFTVVFIPLHSTALYCRWLLMDWTALHCTALSWTILRCTVLHPLYAHTHTTWHNTLNRRSSLGMQARHPSMTNICSKYNLLYEITCSSIQSNNNFCPVLLLFAARYAQYFGFQDRLFQPLRCPSLS